MVEKCVVCYCKCVCVCVCVCVCCLYTIAARRKRSITDGTVSACMYVYVFS